MVEEMKEQNVDVNSIREDGGEDGGAVPHLDPKDEAHLTHKLDVFLVSIFGILYLMAFLDRGNIGSANVASPSISESLGLTTLQYSAATSVVYATYVVFEPVWANLLKIITPKIVLSFSTLCWGIMTISTAWAGNYTHLLVIRILLGIFEAGLFPCITVYLLMTYRREEIGRRMSYIFACSALSGAFGGLIAYGLIQIDNGLVGWQYLYVVEGVISLGLAPLTFFWVPNKVNEAWFLSAKEKEHAQMRYILNKTYYNPDEKFNWHEVIRGLTEWKTYVTGAIQFCADITLYGLSTFMPAIIKGFGFSNVNAQLLTVPVYVVAAIFFIIIARFSDHYQMRSPFIALCFVFLIIGYGILIGTTSVGGRYAGVYICALGLYGIPGLNVSWISNNTAGHYKRVTSLGVNQLIGNCAGAVIGFVYSGNFAPLYLPSFYASIAVSAFGLVLTGIVAFTLWRINKHREGLIAAGAIDQPELGDKNPHFKFFL